MAVVDIFECSLQFEASILKPASQGFVFPPDPLPIDQQGKSFFKAEPAHLRVFDLLLESFGHAGESQGMEFFQSGFNEHRNLPCWSQSNEGLGGWSEAEGNVQGKGRAKAGDPGPSGGSISRFCMSRR